MLWIALTELALLFFLSRKITAGIFYICYRYTHNKKIGYAVLAMLFFPGTIMHELAHWLIAELLRVRTGEISLYPVIEEQGVRLGSVAIAKTDPVRRLLVGLAPIIVGILMIMAITNIYVQYFPDSIIVLISKSHFNLLQHYVLTFSFRVISLIFFYMIFVVGNTMFSSKRDMEGFYIVMIPLAFLTLAMYLAGWLTPLVHLRGPLEWFSSLLAVPLSVIIAVNVMLLVIFGAFKRF